MSSPKDQGVKFKCDNEILEQDWWQSRGRSLLLLSIKKQPQMCEFFRRHRGGVNGELFFFSLGWNKMCFFLSKSHPTQMHKKTNEIINRTHVRFYVALWCSMRLFSKKKKKPTQIQRWQTPLPDLWPVSDRLFLECHSKSSDAQRTNKVNNGSVWRCRVSPMGTIMFSSSFSSSTGALRRQYAVKILMLETRKWTLWFNNGTLMHLGFFLMLQLHRRP